MNGVAVASSIWSCDYVRRLILSFLPKSVLAKAMVLSKATFAEVVDCLYKEITTLNYDRMTSTCYSIPRLRRYTSAIRLIERYGNKAIGSWALKSFSQFPNLRAVRQPPFTLESITPPSSDPHPYLDHGQSKLIVHCQYIERSPKSDNDPIEYIGKAVDMPEEWEHVIFKINSTRVIQKGRGKCYTPPEFEAVFGPWKNKEDIEITIPDVHFQIECPCDWLNEILVKMRRGGIKNKGFRKLSLLYPSASTWEKNIDMIDIIYNASCLTEELSFTLRSKHGSKSKEETNIPRLMTIQDFFKSFASRINPPPCEERVKLRRLTVVLSIDRFTIPALSNLDAVENLPQLPQSFNLESLSILMKVDSDETDLVIRCASIMPRIAQELVKIGGTSCRYSLRYKKFPDQKFVVDICKDELQMELNKVSGMMEKCSSIGWRRLSAEERI
ncbi:hypothetical protein I302_101591 [Kwoniella bestiolae CBS 10118]|uniref:Uncharacterized protein n=1 Tax=Kwoniella bestiolae CBS 10118 TaxID=1296100 RepID=A0A1B9GCN3_9TREE|nr:hypothetical protein I302_00273 [Kwoniella bestiolae CBS 10118]OCF28784.1 hypothetical protein I302_00273 [Kwoniella bestiolae CBS 10118]